MHPPGHEGSCTASAEEDDYHKLLEKARAALETVNSIASRLRNPGIFNMSTFFADSSQKAEVVLQVMSEVVKLCPIEAATQLYPRSTSMSESDPCPICLDVQFPRLSVSTPCKHLFHAHCIFQCARGELEFSCPLCRGACSVVDVVDDEYLLLGPMNIEDWSRIPKDRWPWLMFETILKAIVSTSVASVIMTTMLVKKAALIRVLHEKLPADPDTAAMVLSETGLTEKFKFEEDEIRRAAKRGDDFLAGVMEPAQTALGRLIEILGTALNCGRAEK